MITKLTNNITIAVKASLSLTATVLQSQPIKLQKAFSKFYPEQF